MHRSHSGSYETYDLVSFLSPFDIFVHIFMSQTKETFVYLSIGLKKINRINVSIHTTVVINSFKQICIKLSQFVSDA